MAQLGSYKLNPANIWDSDVNPYGYNDWIADLSDLVRTLEHGDVLEDFLDEKLKRVVRHSNLFSQVLIDDPDFHNEEITQMIADAKSSSSSIVVTTQTLGTASHGKQYKDFKKPLTI